MSSDPRQASLAGLPAYGLFAFFLVTQVTVAGVLQLASIPLGLAYSEVFLFAVPAVLLARASNYRPASFLRLRAPASPLLVLLGLAAGAANFVVAGGLQVLARSLVPEELAKRFDAAHLFQGIGGVELALLTVAVGLFAPVCEEIGFRGWLQRVLRARHGELGGVLAAATLFAVLHLDPIGLVARIELGVLFGLLALWTRSLWPAIAAHAANNLIASGLLLWALKGPERLEQAAPTPPLQALGMAAIGLAGVALVLRAVRRLTAGQPPEEAPEPVDPTQDHAVVPARLGPWLPAWLLAGLGCAALLLTLRATALKVAFVDAAAPVQELQRRLPDEAARKQLEQRLVEAKRQAKSGAVDLESYRAMRKRLSELAKADAGALSLEQVEAAIAEPAATDAGADAGVP